MAITIIDRNSTPSPICKMYDVNFFGETTIFTTVTDKQTVVADWIGNIMNVHHQRPIIVGFDVKPTFHSSSPIAVLQLCVADLCLVYQILHSDRHVIPDRLADFLSANSSATFVGVDMKKELEKLEHDYRIGGRAKYVDLGEFAAEKYAWDVYKSMGLYDLGSAVLFKEVSMPEAVTMSRWNVRQLTAEQVQSACVDAFMSYEIGMVLSIK